MESFRACASPVESGAQLEELIVQVPRKDDDTLQPALTNGKIVFQRGNNSTADIYTITPGATTPALLRKGYHPAFSPDGTKIVFVDNTVNNGSLMIMNANDPASARLLTTPRQGFSPTWSPDGSRLAFVKGDFVSTGNTGSGGIHVIEMAQLSEGANEVLIPGTLRASKPSWGATNRIVYQCRVQTGTFFQNPLGICITETIPATAQQITSNPPAITLIVGGANFNDRDPAWSSDGTQIAFLSTRNFPQLNGSEIYVMDAQGNNVRRVTNVTNATNFKSAPTWAPDGTRIVFARENGQPSFINDLRIVNADGSNGTNPEVLTNLGLADSFPSWGVGSPVVSQSDVRITNIGDTPDPAVIGQTVYYQTQLFNAGPSPATGVKLTTDPLPPGVDYSDQSPAYCVFGANRVVTCTLTNGLGTNGLDNSLRVDIAVTVRQPDTINFKARVTANEQDPTPANNEATATTTVLSSSDMALDVTGPTQAVVDTNVTYSMVVTNNGPDPGFGARAEFNMPTGVDFVSAEPASFNCTSTDISGGKKVTCTLGTVTGTVIPRITVQPHNIGPLTVGGQVFVTGSRDTVSGNDADSQNTTIVDAPRGRPCVCRYSIRQTLLTIRYASATSIQYSSRSRTTARRLPRRR